MGFFELLTDSQQPICQPRAEPCLLKHRDSKLTDRGKKWTDKPIGGQGRNFPIVEWQPELKKKST